MYKRLLLFFVQWVTLCNKCYFVIGEPVVGIHVRYADPENYSFLVGLIRLNPIVALTENIICTGSLITYQHVLTSEHCFDLITAEGFQVLADSTDLSSCSVYHPLWMITYDQWAFSIERNDILPENDVAILKLIQQLPTTTQLGLLSTIDDDETYYGLNATVVGWGRTNYNVILNSLLAGDVTILTINECSQTLIRITGVFSYILPTYFCSVNIPFILVGPGDSGGPLLYQNRIIAICKGTVPVGDYHLQNKLNVHISINWYRDFISLYTLM